MTTQNNPLLQEFNHAPFSKIKNEHFKPAIIKAIEMAREEINAISTNTEEPSFYNTIETLEFSGEKLDRVTSIFFNLNSAETNEEIQQIAQEVSPLLSEFKNDIILNKALFERVKSVYYKMEELDLNTERKTLLDRKYKAFSRNGANLPIAKQNELRDIDKKLSKLSLDFGQNVLAETNKFELHLTDENDLKGLPESFKEEAAQVATSKEKEGWVFTLEYPSYLPFMKSGSFVKKWRLLLVRKDFMETN
jgi:peptidyl-dipeptidase Dcp/oligopeptidase A